MKYVALGLLVAALLLGGYSASADDEKPTGSDADAARCAELEAQVTRLEAENEKLRKTHDQDSANLKRAAKSIDALTNTITAMTDMMPPREESVPSEPMVAKLRERIEGWHRYYGDLIARIGKPAVKPLLAILKADPIKEIRWIAPVFGRIGPDAAEAVAYLKQIAGNKRYQQRGVARLAEEALAKITLSKASAAKTQMSIIENAIDIYRLANKKLPSSLEELTETSGRTPAPFIKSIPNDPWGNPFDYRTIDRTTYQIRSNGLDGMPDTEDDIVWPIEGK